MGDGNELPVSAFLVLSLLAEGQAHGYELVRQVYDRGFRFWTSIQRASIYNALKRLDRLGLVTSTLQAGGGPARRVFRITDEGRGIFRQEALRYLSAPEHPRDELDLGVVALPFLDADTSLEAIEACTVLLRAREAFVAERLSWCRERGLELPALGFARPLRTIRAELEWLEELRAFVARRGGSLRVGEWGDYEYRHPPYTEEGE